MDTLVNVAHGFGVALTPINLLYCFIGVSIGTLVGVLPGIGPISAMSLLLPVTLSDTPESGIIADDARHPAERRDGALARRLRGSRPAADRC